MPPLLSRLSRVAIVLLAAVAAAGVIAAPAAAKGKRVKVTGQVYADNDFELYVNGKLVASDPVDFTPFNVVRVSFRAKYPMTFAIRARDFADPVTGLEYSNTKTGDGGLIASFSSGAHTDASWGEFTTFAGPSNVAQCIANTSTCQVTNTPEPAKWRTAGFKGKWPHATVHSRASVDPHAPDYDSYNWGDASFIWGPDLVQDNTVLLRKTLKSAR